MTTYPVILVLLCLYFAGFLVLAFRFATKTEATDKSRTSATFGAKDGNHWQLAILFLSATGITVLLVAVLWHMSPVAGALLYAFYFFGGVGFTGWRSRRQVMVSAGIMLGAIIFAGYLIL